MPTYIDKALSKHSKALILTFGALVLAASIPTIATGLFSGMYGTQREPSVQEIEDEDYPGEPEDWDETQLHAWLEKVSIINCT